LAQAYFADARLNRNTTLAFTPFVDPGLAAGCNAASAVPFACLGVYLPTQTRSVEFVAQSTVPLALDVSNDVGYVVGFTGAPELYGRTIGPDTVAASLTEPEVPWSLWALFPSEVGPYGPSGAPSAPVAMEAVLNLKAFDASVSADSGDLWSDVTFGTNTYNPLVLAPGQSGTITVTITPSAPIGSRVSGTLYIDTFNGVVLTGDEVVALPYSYIVIP
jgi:hypothetical protein